MGSGPGRKKMEYDYSKKKMEYGEHVTDRTVD